MPRRVWFKLRDVSIEFAFLTNGVDRIRDLREKIVVRYLNRKVQDQVKFYASPAEQQANRPLDLDTKVDGLGVELELPILVDAPLMFPPIRIVPHGLALGAPRLERAQLLDKVHSTLMDDRTRFVLLAAPEESGKTSVLMLYAHQHAQLNCIEVPFMIERASPFEVLRKRCGLDICKKESSLSKNQQHVIMIDDAQDNYDDKAFWKALIADSPSWLPSIIRFIIAATHALEGGVERPIEFQSLKTFTRTDFLVTDEEAHEFLALPAVGLPDKMRDDKETLAEVMVRECGGLIGALRVGVTFLINEFLFNPMPSESELIVHFLSYRCLQQMDMCFGKPATPIHRRFKRFLTKCLAHAPDAVLLGSKLAKNDKKCLVNLRKSGVLVQEDERLVQFSSPLVERFYFKELVPECAGWDPDSLHALVTMVLGSMSASALRASAGKTGGMPTKFTFRQQFMRGIAVSAYWTGTICPELSRVFPAPTTDRRKRGGFDFFVDVVDKWGLEVLVNGQNSPDYTSRFAPGGRYAALEVDDYAVVDLHGNATGAVPDNVCLKNRLITVVIKLGDFSKCQCVLGMDATRLDIDLR